MVCQQAGSKHGCYNGNGEGEVAEGLPDAFHSFTTFRIALAQLWTMLARIG